MKMNLWRIKQLGLKKLVVLNMRKVVGVLIAALLVGLSGWLFFSFPKLLMYPALLLLLVMVFLRIEHNAKNEPNGCQDLEVTDMIGFMFAFVMPAILVAIVWTIAILIGWV